MSATPEVCLRPMRPDDVSGLEAAGLTCPHSSWTSEEFAAELDLPQAHCWVAASEAEGGGLLGAMVFWHVVDEVELLQVVVAPSARRRGVARRLMDRLVAEALRLAAVRIHLEVRADNAAAIALYERSGFGERGRRRGYYQADGTDALLMARTLVDADA